ncbi:MAG: septum formation initiator family protein [Alphaproteobacteria bacterium]|nr:septum formation initiator family protein [Alphaproteobacteria bacterium]
MKHLIARTRLLRREVPRGPFASPLWTVGLMLAGAYFGSHLLLGGDGLIRLSQLRFDLAREEDRLATLTATADRLEHEIALLDDRQLHPDYLEERVRATFGYTRPTEVVILKRPRAAD